MLAQVENRDKSIRAKNRPKSGFYSDGRIAVRRYAVRSKSNRSLRVIKRVTG